MQTQLESAAPVLTVSGSQSTNTQLSPCSDKVGVNDNRVTIKVFGLPFCKTISILVEMILWR